MVHDIAMDYYRKRLAMASSDATIKIIGVGRTPSFGSYLASYSNDGQVIIWKEGNQNEWQHAYVFNEHKSSVNSLGWAPHELGQCLACGSSDGYILIFTTRADAHLVGVISISWEPSMAPGALIGKGLLDPIQKLASGGCNNTIKAWKLYNRTWKMDYFLGLQMHSNWVRDVAWVPNLGLPKSTIASALYDRIVAKEGEQWERKVLKDFNTPVWRVSWLLTGNLLVVADVNNNEILWNEVVDGEWQRVITVEPYIGCMIFYFQLISFWFFMN
ncbi:hypothetical protein UlMin_033029 [Ulmus minor]